MLLELLLAYSKDNDRYPRAIEALGKIEVTTYNSLAMREKLDIALAVAELVNNSEGAKSFHSERSESLHDFIKRKNEIISETKSVKLLLVQHHQVLATLSKDIEDSYSKMSSLSVNTNEY